jgi:hypothetical protein
MPERWVQVHYNPEDCTESVVETEGYSKRQKDIDTTMILTIFPFTLLAILGTLILTMRLFGYRFLQKERSRNRRRNNKKMDAYSFDH